MRPRQFHARRGIRHRLLGLLCSVRGHYVARRFDPRFEDPYFECLFCLEKFSETEVSL